GLGFIGCIGTGTLTIGPAASIIGGRAVLGQNVLSAGSAGFINQGTITSNIAGAPITINSSGSGVCSNSGTIHAAAGASLSILAGSWSNSGPLTADRASTLSLARPWSTTGSGPPSASPGPTLTRGGAWSL